MCLFPPLEDEEQGNGGQQKLNQARDEFKNCELIQHRFASRNGAFVDSAVLVGKECGVWHVGDL